MNRIRMRTNNLSDRLYIYIAINPDNKYQSHVPVLKKGDP